MKASEFIKCIEYLMCEHGDLEVMVDDGIDYMEAEINYSYDEHGVFKVF